MQDQNHKANDASLRGVSEEYMSEEYMIVSKTVEYVAQRCEYDPRAFQAFDREVGMAAAFGDMEGVRAACRRFGEAMGL